MIKAKGGKQRCGMVSIIGRPNVGKSTLLNQIIGEKVAIVSRVPQTTRNQVRGMYNDERGQIIFIDTPGLHLGKDKLDKFMNNTASGTIVDADCIIYLVDTSRLTGEEEEKIAGKVKNVKVPVILGLNKIDLKRRNVPQYIALWERIKGQPVSAMKNFTLLPLSGFKGTNVEKLLDILFEYMPEGPLLYPTDIICDVPQKVVVADIITPTFFGLDITFKENLGLQEFFQILPRQRSCLFENLAVFSNNNFFLRFPFNKDQGLDIQGFLPKGTHLLNNDP